ncbi:MAG: DUF4340 domain-containing protein [Candidatus Omnitrophica bacterium]|nr:DUF4340 domain-containing protein [Candidatus Omnitrophota bacterium]
MKSKHLTILAIVFISLLVVTLIMKAVKPKPPKEENLVDIIESLVTPGTITTCQINFQDKEVILQKKNEVWVVKNQHDALVDMAKFEPLITKIDQMAGELRSAQEDLLSDYGITDDEGLRIKLQEGEVEVADIIVGAKKSGIRNFARKAGSAEVYILDKGVLDEMGLFDEVSIDDFREDYWVDKRIVHFGHQQVKSLSLEKDGKPVLKIITEIVDERKRWKTAEEYPFIVDPTRVQRYVKALSEAKAAEIVSSEESSGFEASRWKIQIEMDDESVINIVLGDEKDGLQYLKNDNKDYQFKMSADFLRKFDKTDGELFMTNLFSVNPQTLEELYVKDARGRKTYHIIKQATEGVEDGKEFTWLSSAGEELEAEAVIESLMALKDIRMMTQPGPVSLPKNMLTIKISRSDGPDVKYKITRAKEADDKKEYHYLKVKDDSRGYGIKTNQIEYLRDALKKVFEKKKKWQESRLEKK